jgi:hypothetical protein
MKDGLTPAGVDPEDGAASIGKASIVQAVLSAPASE